MKISPPTIMVYGCSFERACEIVSKHSLRNCGALPRPVVGLSFQTDADSIAFKLALGEDIEFDTEVAIVFPHHQDLVEGYLSESGIGSRVFRYELLGMEFWDANDLAVFDQAFKLI